MSPRGLIGGSYWGLTRQSRHPLVWPIWLLTVFVGDARRGWRHYLAQETHNPEDKESVDACVQLPQAKATIERGYV